MDTKKGTRYFLLGSLLACALLYFAGCSDTNTLSPTETSALTPTTLAKKGKGGDGTDPAAASDLLMVRKREENEDGVSSAVIGPEGGFLVHAAHRLDVSAGALSEPMELTFSMPVSDTLMFDLGPDGTQFDGPVKLTVSWDHAFTSGLDETQFKVVVWNPTTQVWESVPTSIDTELNLATGDLLTGSLKHFSRYAIRK
ncbi:MAG: hypothetical protein D6743_20300 [Calditrichaeota bacterium]|nr:MAG: hypothetical protein D6743_20300 [Calditrichota bacterium]